MQPQVVYSNHHISLFFYLEYPAHTCILKDGFINYNDVIYLGIKLRPPCEVVVRYVLPTFRSLVAKELIEKYHFSQVDAAKKLGTTQAAISHYLYSKRGDKRMKQLETVSKIQSVASEMAQSIVNEELSVTDAMLNFCRLCTILRDQNIICNLHKDFISSLPDTCDICQKISQTQKM